VRLRDLSRIAAAADPVSPNPLEIIHVELSELTAQMLIRP